MVFLLNLVSSRIFVKSSMNLASNMSVLNHLFTRKLCLFFSNVKPKTNEFYNTFFLRKKTWKYCWIIFLISSCELTATDAMKTAVATTSKSAAFLAAASLSELSARSAFAGFYCIYTYCICSTTCTVRKVLADFAVCD